MNRSCLLAAFCVASLALAQPASAQFGGGMWGTNSANNLDIQKQRNDLKAQQQKYAAPAKSRAASKPPALSLGAADPYGRIDLSGRPAPGYAAIRDNGAIAAPFHRPRARSAPSIYRPRAATPSPAIPPTPRTSRATRIPPPPPIFP